MNNKHPLFSNRAKTFARHAAIYLLLVTFAVPLKAQTNQNNNAPATATQQRGNTAPTANGDARTQSRQSDLEGYGVTVAPDARVIVTMAALEVAGLDPTAQGVEPSTFRAQVRRDMANIDQGLRTRLREYFDKHKLPAPATAADQSAPYLSLALTLGQPPNFDLPLRTDDLPQSILSVLDFRDLLREFYQKSKFAQLMPGYMRVYATESDRLRAATLLMTRRTVAYLRTRPVTSIIERIPLGSADTSGNSTGAQRKTIVRERPRRFLVVPDLLAAPNTINFRIFADDYYAIISPDVIPDQSELRRAFLEYVFDAVVGKFNREIALRRADIKRLQDESAIKPDANAASSAAATTNTQPGVFTVVARSLVAATDARMSETARLEELARRTSGRLQNADAATRARVTGEAQAERERIADETAFDLSESYRRGALLSFYFAEQLRGLESSGFDIQSLFPDMVQSFTVERELKRPAEFAQTRERVLAARRAAQAARTNDNRAAATNTGALTIEESRRVALVEKLAGVDELLRAKNYTEAERRLRVMLQEYQGEARIFFALGQAASISAQDATDTDVQAERLNRALTNYRASIEASSEDTEPDRALRSRAYTAMGRIFAFLEREQEAVQAFDAAIKLEDVRGGAYKEAVAAKQRLTGGQR